MKNKILNKATKLCAFGAFLSLSYVGGETVFTDTVERVNYYIEKTKQETLVNLGLEKIEPQEPEKNIKQIIKENADRYNVSPILIAAIAERESGYKPDAIRFEAKHMSIAAKITKNPDEQRMYASSIGVMQVMGWHSPKYNLKYSDLFNVEKNIEIGTVILKNCLDKWKGETTKYRRIAKACECYNGSAEYGEAIVQRLGALLIERSM